MAKTDAQYRRACHRAKGGTDEWFTPPEIIQALGVFDLDPACGPLCKTKTAARKIGPKRDGLRAKWRGRVWLNPPFSNAAPFIRRMMDHGDGIALIFTRMDANWFQEAMQAAGWVFVFRGRIQFLRPGITNRHRCPLGCALLPFGDRNVEAIRNAGFRGSLLQVDRLAKGGQ